MKDFIFPLMETIEHNLISFDFQKWNSCADI